MIYPGMNPLRADRQDYSLLETFKNHPAFGAVVSDPSTLPANFSIYDGRDIPNQLLPDTRFTPALPPLAYGCTGEAGAFSASIQDNELYDPEDLFLNTPPVGDTSQGRDIRLMLGMLKTRGPRKEDGTFGPTRGDYYNCYGAGKIDDTDAARIGLWINQYEKRGVIVGTWWYPEFSNTGLTGSLPTPSFNTSDASLHCYLITGWRTNPDGTLELEAIPWLGREFGTSGRGWMPKAIYNALMRQPYTGAFTQAKTPATGPQSVGIKAQIDHIAYVLAQFVFQLYFGMIRT